MEQQQNEKRLRVKYSTFQTEMSFNEWVSKYGVSSGYVEPTKYFQGNPSCGIHPSVNLEEHPIRTFLRNLLS
jgi:hypothetical protein